MFLSAEYPDKHSTIHIYMFFLFYFILGGPVAFTMVLIYTTYILGPSALPGCFIFLVMFPIQVSRELRILFLYSFFPFSPLFLKNVIKINAFLKNMH